MNGIDEGLRDLLLCAAFSGNDWDLEDFKKGLESGTIFIKEVIDLKEDNVEEYKRLQDVYLNRWKI